MSKQEQHSASMSGQSIGDVECTPRGNVVVARIFGEVDLSNAERVGAKVAAATPESAVGVVLDLIELAYLDSAGINVIHRLRQRLAERGQGLILVVSEASQVHRTLDVVRVPGQIPITQSVDDAVRALHAARDPKSRDTR